MRYTFTFDFSQEDLAALAACGYRPDCRWDRPGFFWSKPASRDVKKFIRDCIKEGLTHKYVSSGASRSDFIKHWQKEEKSK